MIVPLTDLLGACDRQPPKCQCQLVHTILGGEDTLAST